MNILQYSIIKISIPYISLDITMSYSIQQNYLPMSYLLRRLDFAKFNIWEDLIWLWLKTIDVVISSSTMKVEDSKKIFLKVKINSRKDT